MVKAKRQKALTDDDRSLLQKSKGKHTDFNPDFDFDFSSTGTKLDLTA